MKRAYTDIPEGQMHYRSDGSGETVLLLHMACASSDEYTRVIPFLSKNYHVVAPDFLGFGESDPAPRQYQIADHAKTIVSFMDTLGIKKASVVGHHVGARVAAELAAIIPDRVDKLVLSSCPYYRDLEAERSRENFPVYSRMEISADGAHLMEWWNRAIRFGDTPEIAEERALDYHKAGPRGEELHWASFEYGARLLEVLPAIKYPTLVMSGSKDHWIDMLEDIKKLIPRSKIAVIQNGPVYIDRVMPKEFAEAILTFFQNPSV